MHSHPLLSQLTSKACKIAKKTGVFIENELGKIKGQDIELKSLNSLVSYVDKTAEEILVKELKEILPCSAFLTEEETVKQEKKEYRWIIDPLDGTTNFIHQIPVFSISIALQKEKKTILGVVYEINRKECFYAWKDGGAFLNGKKIHVSKTNSLKNSLLATGFPYHDFRRVDGYLKVLKYFMFNTRGVRRMGSAAVDLAYVACGRFDGFFEYSLNAWDVAAGAIIVEEAGGKVSDFSGKDDFLFGKEIVASNPNLYFDFFEIIKSQLKI